jgi:hypothetical protein
MHNFQCDVREWMRGDRNDAHYYSVVTLHGHKYLILLALITILHSFTFLLRVFLSLLLLAMMEDKRDTKRSCSPSKEGSSSLSGVSTPLSVLSRSLPQPGSPLEGSSSRPNSTVLEQGGSSEKFPVVDLSSSSDGENLIPDTSRDEEFAKRLFSDLNRGLLGSLGDGKVMILSDSNEEEEVHEEDTTDAKAVPSSTVKSWAPTTTVDNADDADKGHSPDWVIGDSSGGRDKAVSP